MQIGDSDQQNNIEEAGDSIHGVDDDNDETLEEGAVIDSEISSDEAEDEGAIQDQMDHIEPQPSTYSGLPRSTRTAAKQRKVIYAVDDESSSDDERVEVCLLDILNV